MGIPIYATKGKGGGIALLDDFVMDRSLLSNQEKEQILMALQGILATEQNPTDELLSKLAGLFQSPNTSWIEVDFSNWVKNSHDQDTFNIIKSAIFSHNVISFQYFSSKGHTQRQVEPLRLVFKSKDWYLYGFCRTRNDFRFFKLTRIKKLEKQSEIFSRNLPVGYSVAKQMNIETTIPVKLKFDPQMAFRVYDEFSDSVTEDEQGNLYVQTHLPNGNALYSYLLSYADCVEVLEPDSVRKQMREKITIMQGEYIT